MSKPSLYVGESADQHAVFKGWILTVEADEPFTLTNSGAARQAGRKWVPKFAVLTQRDKSMILYDTEPTSLCNESTAHYRLDGSLRREGFLNAWRNKACKYETNIDFGFSANRRPSHKDPQHTDKDSPSVTTPSENDLFDATIPPNTPTNGTAFRFAGLFFKKSEKKSSLKRAKSGIQLERKKQQLGPGSIAAPVIAAPQHEQVAKTQSAYDNDADNQSLFSPMRPSRSHESLMQSVRSPATRRTLQPPSSIHLDSISDADPVESDAPLRNHHTPMRTIKSTTISNINGFEEERGRTAGHVRCVTTQRLRLDLNTDRSAHFHAIHDSLLDEENCLVVRCIQTRLLAYCYDEAEDEDDEEVPTRRSRSRLPLGKCSSAPPQNKRPAVMIDERVEETSRALIVRLFMCRSGEEREKWLQCLRSVCTPQADTERRADNSLQLWLLEAKGATINAGKPLKRYFCEIKINDQLFARTSTKEKKEILFWGETFDFNVAHIEGVRVELYQDIETKKKSKKQDQQPMFLGFVTIPLSAIESPQPVEKWYCLEAPSGLGDTATPSPKEHPPFTSTHSFTAASITTSSFHKDATSMRIKAKYQSVDILPIKSYQRLIEYIRSNYLSFMVALEPHLSVRLKDDLANSLVRIAHKLNIQTHFLSDLVMSDVLQSEDTSLTFRGNSLATKSMESYMKLVGDAYLKQTLSDCVRSIVDTAHDLEIDPSKCSGAANLQSNREELVQILHLVCGRVFNSPIYFPVEMRRVFARLRDLCARAGKSDEMCDYLISASIFLRFICPAILSPNLFGLTNEYPSEKPARKLTLVAKTLQTIANFSRFGAKEVYMSFDKMNSFVEEHTHMMREFLHNISTLTPEERDGVESAEAPLTPTSPNRTRSFDQQETPSNVEVPFNMEIIDLGKQLSVLHTLLTTVAITVNNPSKLQFDDELTSILSEITELKSNTSSKPVPQHCNANHLFSYENRLHYAIQANSKLASPQWPLTPTSPFNAKPKYSSQFFVSIDGSDEASLASSHGSVSAVLANAHRPSAASTISQQQNVQFEEEINVLKNKLRDTEISLRREQTEKQTIEQKLKQQQKESDHQMKSIINRLIQVEEELRKEQGEMHKLLKTKQELIEIQKRRIECLSSSRSCNNVSVLGHSQPLQLQPSCNFTTSHPAATYHQHAYQPKPKHATRKSQGACVTSAPLVPVSGSTSSVSSNNSTNDCHTPANSHRDFKNNSQSQVTGKPRVQQLQFSDKPMFIGSDPSTEIAASPSSSSSSMTQFCSYLAANSTSLKAIDAHVVPHKSAKIIPVKPFRLHTAQSTGISVGEGTATPMITSSTSPSSTSSSSSVRSATSTKHPSNPDTQHLLRTSEL